MGGKGSINSSNIRTTLPRLTYDVLIADGGADRLGQLRQRGEGARVHARHCLAAHLLIQIPGQRAVLQGAGHLRTKVWGMGMAL